MTSYSSKGLFLREVTVELMANLTMSAAMAGWGT